MKHVKKSSSHSFSSAFISGLNSLLVFFFWASVATSWAASMTVPVKSDPGAMFVVEVTIGTEERDPVRITFEPALVQYAGSVTPTEEVQSPGDSVIEIIKQASETKKFSLKFLPLAKASETTMRLQSAKDTDSQKVVFASAEPEKSYHFHILGLAVVLLILAKVFWNHQKKSPALMSTRSLFLNLNELQKVRDQYFPGTEGEEKPASSPNVERSSDAKSEPKPVSPPEPTLESRPEPEPEQPVAPVASAGPGKTKPSHPAVVVVSPPSPEPQPPVTSGGTMKTKSVSGTQARVIIPETPEPEPELRAKVSGTKPSVSLPKNPDTSEAKTIARPTVKSGISANSSPPGGGLRVKLVDATGAVFQGEGVEVTLGRRKDNTIAFSNSEISRNHAAIKIQNKKTVLVPVSASSLTELNGKEIKEPTELKAGDTIALGGTQFKVELLELL